MSRRLNASTPMSPTEEGQTSSFEYFAPSKSARKREMTELQKLGERLLTLSKEQLQQLDLSEALYDSVRLAQKTTSREGKRRLRQYIGKLMRHTETEPIEKKLAVWDGVSAAAVEDQHRLERARDRLLDNDEYFTYFVRQFPQTPVQVLRTHIREARKEQQANAVLLEGQTAQKKHYRALFQAIKNIMQSTENLTENTDITDETE